ncbi:hypothetical protein ACFS3C_23665 [Azotobacter vinelandii]|uniref:hypothetical protein n=1 Tax=Azotobacter TaxID=352 RepID=UPI000932015F|nr:hypothetical protein [Azotobacter vinelandii]
MIGKPDPCFRQDGEGFRPALGRLRGRHRAARRIVRPARKHLGAAVAPRTLDFPPGLSRTRDGTPMRRLPEARELGLPDGDTSTLESPYEPVGTLSRRIRAAVAIGHAAHPLPGRARR